MNAKTSYTYEEVQDKIKRGDLTGLTVDDLSTPVLLIDLDRFEKNLGTMGQFFRGKPVTFRPHGKAHKSPEIAKRQIASGARGVCAAKLGEAEVLVNGGITDVLITTEVVGRHKIERLTTLAEKAPQLKVVVDHAQNVKDLSDAALARGIKLKVLIEVDIGQQRCGVEPGQPTVALAEHIAKNKGLEFLGMQAYGGHLMHITGYEKRKAASRAALARVTETRAMLEKAGFEVNIVSVGGTGTYSMDWDVPGVTEMQPGSYIFMDAHYRSIGGKSGATYDDFGCALTVLATVISRPSEKRAVIDAGNKCLSIDEGFAVPKALTGVEFTPGGDEHGKLLLENPEADLRLGARIELIPGHCDTTVNLFDRFYGVRKGRVEKIWTIAARGRSD